MGRGRWLLVGGVCDTVGCTYCLILGQLFGCHILSILIQYVLFVIFSLDSNKGPLAHTSGILTTMNGS